MAETRRTFTREYKLSAVKLITEQGRSIAEAARSLGAGWATIIFRVILPNLRVAVLSAGDTPTCLPRFRCSNRSAISRLPPTPSSRCWCCGGRRSGERHEEFPGQTVLAGRGKRGAGAGAGASGTVARRDTPRPHA